MSQELLREKLDQANALVAGSNFDVWLTFVRETAEGGDPILPFLLEGSLTWQSALMIGRRGERVAVVGRYDADPLRQSGNWPEVVGYDKSIRKSLLEVLERLAPGNEPKIAVNFSTNDDKCDGLSHGMYLLLEGYLKGTRFEDRLFSSEEICGALRGRKSTTERALMRAAIEEGDAIFHEVERMAKVGITEKQVFDFVHRHISAHNLGFSWDPAQDPIVNSGPDSMIGHGIPSNKITLQPGHIFHIDLGVNKAGYSSDIQRSWYVRGQEEEVPRDVLDGFAAVRAAILAGFAKLRPGVLGWEVDAVARETLTAAGFEEYQHALGHQVGRVAHDGGALLGPKWERYGKSPMTPVSEGEVYTLELGVILPGRGYLGLEEMVTVTQNGCGWLSDPQTELWVIG